jgi:5-(carboxyamino)imidazole ribonucleotide synthase
LNTVGIIGAGQLGQMLGFAAEKLGLRCIFIDPSENPPAAATGRVIAAAFDDADALEELARCCDVITYEFENVPVAAVRAIEAACPVLPPPPALERAQDRLAEKQLFEALRIPIPGYSVIDVAEDLQRAAENPGLPLVVKTRRLGYDGKGQAILRDPGRAATVFDELGGRDLIAEQFVNFDYEVSAIGARSPSGEVVTYALSRNEHRDGILRLSRAPAGNALLTAMASDYLERLLTELHYVGVLALELFVDGDKLLANEFAPRVHNSGHWTIEGANASQFENHLRAITGMPLADTAVTGFPGMVNIIGSMPSDLTIFEAAGAIVHDYGKAPRPGRKLGHATLIGDSIEDRDARLLQLQDALSE